MKRASTFAFALIVSVFMSVSARSQTMKIGVFDIELMVQAMPGYLIVDSLMGVYNRDSLTALQDYYLSEYQRLDSTFKSDSAQAASGKKPKAIVDIIAAERQKAMINVVYWQQIAQNKSDAKRSELSKELFTAVVNAYKKVLARKKYTLVLKPQSYEDGFKIDNIFIAVARELKLTQLPQNLLFLGDDPDPVKQPQTQKPPVTKPKS